MKTCLEPISRPSPKVLLHLQRDGNYFFVCVCVCVEGTKAGQQDAPF